jgi:cytochrome oxidase Cu insertion factor (SCO1/SenC/PrrC family)
MSRPQKIVTTVLWIIAVTVMLGILLLKMLPPVSSPTTRASEGAAEVLASSTDPPDAAPPVLFSAPNFRLVDQDGQATTSAQLVGHPWVADFIFTTCASLCPTMSADMAELQKQLPADVMLVSFSVDPVHDTPAALKSYAGRYHAQEGRWFFLTGDEKTQDQVIRAMKIGVIAAKGSNPIEHDEHFVLVDAQGQVRGYYDSLVPQRLAQLVADARKLSTGALALGAGGGG